MFWCRATPQRWKVKLRDSINKNDKAGISAAQLMIDTATKQTEKRTNELAEV